MGRLHQKLIAAAAVTACLCSAAFLAPPPAAQTAPGKEARKTQDLSAALRVIVPLMREDLQRAVQMLETLDRRYPGEPEVLIRLGEGYGALGEVDSAVAAYRRCVAANPTDVRAGAALGVLLIQRGERDEGDAVYRELIVRTGRSVNTYRTIGATLAARGYYDLALRMYEEGRGLDRAYVLTLDIAQLHRTMGDFEACLEDYIHLIETSPRHYTLARDEILQLFGDARADGDQLLDRLVAAAERDSFASEPEPDRREPQAGTRGSQGLSPRRKIMELLALVYLQQGMLENALETALEAETTGDPEGKVLFTLAEQTARESREQSGERRVEYFDTAVRAVEAYIDGHPDAPQIPRAKLLLVGLLTDVASGQVAPPPGLALEGATAKAIETLDWMIESFAGSEHAEEAYLEKGDLVFRVKKQPREAIAVFEEGLSAARLRTVAFAERLGRLYLVVGDYDKAGAYLTRLVNDKEPELRETGVYYVGLLLAINGRYEAARDTLTSLAEKNPSSRFTNDAIEVSWAIEEGLRGDQRMLGRYVDALRCEVAEDTTGAIGSLAEIAALSVEAPLRPRALFLLGALYRGSGMYQNALEVYESFARDYPTHPWVPDVHRGIGQVYEDGFGDVGRALEKYEDILLSYPHYILLDEVRDEVTRLRDRIGAHDGSS